MASYNLEDVAQHWFLQLQEDEGTPPWGRFKQRLNLRFGPTLRSAPLFELTECRHTGTVEEYSNRFQGLLARAGRLEEGQRVRIYTGGLLPPLSHHVRIHRPETLDAAISLARHLELIELDRLNQAPTRAVARTTLPAPATRPAAAAAAVLPAPALPAPQAPLALPTPPAKEGGQQTKCLSQEEQAERRHLGLCYNCNETYSRGHNRVCRRIFYTSTALNSPTTKQQGRRPCSPCTRWPGWLSVVPSSSTCTWDWRISSRSLTPAPHTVSLGKPPLNAPGCLLSSGPA